MPKALDLTLRTSLWTALDLLAAAGLFACSPAAAPPLAPTPSATSTFQSISPTLPPTSSPRAGAIASPTLPSSPTLMPTAVVKPAVTASPTVGISPNEAAQVLPLQPAQVTVAASQSAVLVRWRGTGEDITRYEVYRKNSDAKDWQTIASVAPVQDNRGAYEWRDTTTIPRTAYVYGVAAVNGYGKKSSIAESAAITTP